MNENGHWYDPLTSEPRHWIQCKTRVGTRPTTLADAKKLSLVPSITTVLKILDKPALTRWLITQAVHAVCTAPDLAGENLDAKIERVLVTEKQADEEAKRARDLGTEIHEALSEHLCGRLYAPQFKPFVDAAVAQVATLGWVVSTEKVLINPIGFGGRTDLIMEDRELLTVTDYKSCKVLPKKSAWPEHVLQTSAYASSIGNSGSFRIQTAVLYISTVDPGKTALFVNPDWQESFEVFKCIFRTWCYMTGYTPTLSRATSTLKEAKDAD